MSCNIVELGGLVKDSNDKDIFKRNFYIDKAKIVNELDIFKQDKYMTVYSYENKNVDTCNFIAPLYIDLDIDDIENNYDKLIRDLKIIYRQLKLLFYLNDDDIKIYFSGAKGFHIIVNENIFGFKPSRTLNKDLKKIAIYLKAYTITKCIDTKIYDYKRLFRINNSVNSKTNLYKVQVKYNDVINMNYEQLKEYASSTKHFRKTRSKYNEKANENFYKLIDEIDKKEASKINMKLAHEFLKKKELLPCVKYILQNGSPNGNRNNTTVALANSLFQIGNSLEEVTEIITQWNMLKNSCPLSQNEINTTILSAYKNSKQDIFYGCSSFKELDVCVKNCPIHK